MTFVFFQSFGLGLGTEKFNLSSDTVKFMLTNTAPNPATDDTYSDVSGTELANGNGYTTGGAGLTSQAWTQTAGVAKFVATAPIWTATGSMGPFRYVIAYDDSAPSKELIGYADRGASLTLIAADTYSASIDPTTGLFTVG